LAWPWFKRLYQSIMERLRSKSDGKKWGGVCYQSSYIPRGEKLGGFMDNKKNILLVDDEEIFLEQLKEALKASYPEFTIDTAENGVCALERLSESRYDIVLTDIKMPRMNGITLLKEIRSRYPSTYVVMITAFGNVSSAVEAMKYGAYDFLENP